MKTALVLAGPALLLARQAAELNAFLAGCELPAGESEAWILTDEPTKKGKNASRSEILPEDFSPVLIGLPVERVRFVPVFDACVSESCLDALCALQEREQAELLLFAQDALSGALAARAGHRLGGSACLGVRALCERDQCMIAEKKVYSNNLVARFALKKAPYCVAVAKETAAETGGQPTAQPTRIIEEDSLPALRPDWLRAIECEAAEAGEDLSAAKTVVAIGQGIGSRENVAIAQRLCDLLGAKLGASRPVVMNAWTDMDRLIGASGALIAPELCIALAVSGAAAFSAGVEKSKQLVAVNTDPKAPVFKLADVGVVADWREIALELINLLSREEPT